jgi:hypothetical protein
MTDKAISPLRRRLIEDMTIRRLSPKTHYQYIRHVKKFADFLGRSADKATPEDCPSLSVMAGLDRDVGGNIGTSLPNIDFCALASGQGVKAISVNRRGALDEALCSAFATTAEPTLVEVAVD